jgi:hypothetical protein
MAKKKKTKKTKKKVSKKNNSKKQESKSDKNTHKSKKSREQVKQQEKLLRNFLILIGVIFIALMLGIYIKNYTPVYTYKNIEFEEFPFNDELTFYKTTFPRDLNGKRGTHEVFLRTNPNELKKVPFEGEFVPKQAIIFKTLNKTQLNCDGHLFISIKNFAQTADAMGLDSGEHENSSCEPGSRYVYAEIRPGEETKIIQTDEQCYQLYVNNCEVLEVTERFLAELLVYRKKVTDNLKNN